ncbi:unnamed protein product [Spirodela intermedia]|uniref:Uncharacterized protein n=1 Tax=Spirodela intermedia TaxID=51605 RepID=A0A7I8IQK9_SPIIN|nr:unnamed protein product [Spirodela intermedia]CAA6660268.1 unnamed protein product [Spirodela intermedia]
MEGIIPYVYREIKRRRTRSRYVCLSSEGARSSDPPTSDSGCRLPPPPANVHGHRRHRSMEDFSVELSQDGYARELPLGKGASFRSSRMLPFIAGA